MVVASNDANNPGSGSPDGLLDEKRSSHTADTLQDATQPPAANDLQDSSNEKRPRRNTNTDNVTIPDSNYLMPPAEDALRSPGSSRIETHRLNDDLELLRAEQIVSENELSHSRSKRHEQNDLEDIFATGAVVPTDEEEERPRPEKKAGLVGYFFRRWLKKLPRSFRYFLYLLPGAALFLIPILMGHYFDNAPLVGGRDGVALMWFGIWLMVVWCTLWGSRMLTSLMPSAFGAFATLFGSTNHKKWKDVGRNLELHTGLFIWLLIVLVTFQPINNIGRRDPDIFVQWMDIVNKVIIALFVLATLNFAEKIGIQRIATTFHQRTYAQRIEMNKSNINHLVHLYAYARERIAHEDPIWDTTDNAIDPAQTRTPRAALQAVRQVFNKAGLVANRVGNDFIGRKTTFNHDKNIVTELLRTTSSSHTLARLIFRSLANADHDTIYPDDLAAAFATVEEAEHAFSIFDKDYNGDISMEEMEIVVNEIHLERKAIAASLKDLDSVIKKLDKVFLFIIFIVAIIVFIAILSGSAAAGLASAGSAVLGLAWVLQATAQEFLQSIIFVFVKHPFDVGDRVTIYGSTGVGLQGDDYYVTEISLLYTEFKKMEGHIVQAPNSVLNNLFILNQRRSAGLADVVELNLGFATPPESIEMLKDRMLQYCLANKRDYQHRVLTEVRTLNNVQSFTMNFIFFHKSNYQNELLRLTRHNKFVAQLMAEIRALGMQGPWQVQPGGSRDYPVHWASAMPPPSYDASGRTDGNYPAPAPAPAPAPVPAPAAPATAPLRSGSTGIPPGSRPPNNNEPAARQIPVIDANISDFQDVFESRKPDRTPQLSRLQSIREHTRMGHIGRTSGESSSLRQTDSRAAATGASAHRPSTDSASHRRPMFGGRPRSQSQARPGDFV
ncbi:hypothetical protein SODALDRAFT_150498 [Sodiomyces alkalinus F11]|uniref:EF-hand domain-containing protein n=1 Tax=Sodiomyces alkalinus (strain CBS 110278 / VKM F-3762 / F11) TaxID=1314773 RepID=A0A3N2PWY2_SODAK|nr:hypothetical protein SODALDRAFT_150498 [Sodiomyces alkalinus F11]ROT39008.1 hypothetical protein SODALDRAFT_150498 [Sodiomyces alkalinus F11]